VTYIIDCNDYVVTGLSSAIDYSPDVVALVDYPFTVQVQAPRSLYIALAGSAAPINVSATDSFYEIIIGSRDYSVGMLAHSPFQEGRIAA
jgi:hypothetical protein